MPTANPFIISVPDNFLADHPGLKHDASRLAHAYAANDQLVTDAALQAIGMALWHSLDVTEPFAAALAQAGSATLPIIIESGDAAVHQLPWETLYHPEHGFLARENGFTLSRRVPDRPAPATPPDKGPLRVLLFTALPDDLDAEKERLDIEAEQAQILDALAPLLAEGLAVLEMPDDGRFSTLEKLLQNTKPHLVFLGGHGTFHHDPLSKQPPASFFLFEGEDGGSELVDEKRVAAAFRGSSVECAVLVSCELGKTASDALNAGLVWQLSAAGVPHVVGMRESVLDRAGTLFARAFADAIARKERVDAAVQSGRRAIITPLKDSPLLGGDSALAELSLGQWSLPLLLSRQPERALLDWEFEAQPTPERAAASLTLETVTLPPQFIGRRAELRTLKSRLRTGQLRQLLITGPGGQGKTALAGKLALDLHRRGYEVVAYAARPENIWRKFTLDVIRRLSDAHRDRYASMERFLETEAERAEELLRLLLAQSGGQVVLFLDNLETAQDPDYPHGLADERLAAWLAAGQKLTDQGLILLATSRWRLPDWPEADHLSLAHASTGDFLRMGLALVEQGKLAAAWLTDRQRMRQVYDALHGNGRGLSFFAGAVQGMAGAEEAAFLEKLTQAQAETVADMALQTVIARLDEAARALLPRLAAYQMPVPLEGVVKVGLADGGLPDGTRPEEALTRLLAVSLVEQTDNARWQAREYQLTPLAAEMGEAPAQAVRQAAAAYQLYLFENERRTLAQAVAVHQALRAAGDVDGADLWALDYIVGPLNRDGLYETLLAEWLPPICESQNLQIQAEALGQTGKQHLHLGNYDQALPFFQRSLKISQEIGDKSGEGTTLNNISQIYDARGDYDTALAYLERSLKIRQEIGDAAGLCATLFNMGHIYLQNEQVNEALSAWVTVYQLASRMNYAQALQALEGLARNLRLDEQLGVPPGLAGWAALAQRKGSS
ncbi:MAG: CHAT domain-containing protein [Chloroflexi bacterium]|nr:MAG: CHAT domain-containing protein [Chloroflexota bacterium]